MFMSPETWMPMRESLLYNPMGLSGRPCQRRQDCIPVAVPRAAGGVLTVFAHTGGGSYIVREKVASGLFQLLITRTPATQRGILL